MVIGSTNNKNTVFKYLITWECEIDTLFRLVKHCNYLLIDSPLKISSIQIQLRSELTINYGNEWKGHFFHFACMHSIFVECIYDGDDDDVKVYAKLTPQWRDYSIICMQILFLFCWVRCEVKIEIWFKHVHQRDDTAHDKVIIFVNL